MSGVGVSGVGVSGGVSGAGVMEYSRCSINWPGHVPRPLVRLGMRQLAIIASEIYSLLPR